MATDRGLISITDKERILQIETLGQDLLEDIYHLSISWLSDHQWFAMPLFDPIDFGEAENISMAARRFGYDACFATSTRDGYSDVYEVRMTQQGLVEFGGESSLYPILLFPEDRQFAILADGNLDCYVVAGSKTFIQHAIKKSWKDLRFDYEAEAEKEVEIYKNLLLNNLKYYLPFVLEE